MSQIIINGRTVVSTATFADALSADWPRSLALVGSPESTVDLIKRFGTAVADQSLHGVINEVHDRSTEFRLVRLIARANPRRVPMFESIELTQSGLSGLARAAAVAGIDRAIVGAADRRMHTLVGAEPDPSEALVSRLWAGEILTAAAVADRSGIMAQIDETWHREVAAALTKTRSMPEHDDVLDPADPHLVKSLLLLDAMRIHGGLEPIDDPAASRWSGYVADRPTTAGAGMWLRYFMLAVNARREIDTLKQQYEPLSARNKDLLAQNERLSFQLGDAERRLAEFQSQEARLRQTVDAGNTTAGMLAMSGAVMAALYGAMVLFVLFGKSSLGAVLTVLAAIGLMVWQRNWLMDLIDRMRSRR